jgi:hypothetical protein
MLAARIRTSSEQTSLPASPARRTPGALQIISHHFEDNDIVAAGDRFAFRRRPVVNRDATELALRLLHHLGKLLRRKRLTCLVRKRQKDFDEIGQRIIFIGLEAERRGPALASNGGKPASG